jgi:non-specific serine/threonine protein kinase
MMLETIREFGLAQLAGSDEAAVRRAHADYFLTLAERHTLDDFQPDCDRVPAPLDAEHDNLRAALTWLDAAGDSAAFLRLAVALGSFWRQRGDFQDGRAWLERALARESPEAAGDLVGSRGVRARAAANLGVFEMYQGAFSEAESHLTEGLAGCRAQGDTLHAAMALMGLAHLATSRGDRVQGTALLREVLAVAQSASDRRLADMLAGNALNNLAVVARAEGDHSQAAACLEEALSRMRGAGIARGATMALGDLGDLARDQGHYARAMTFYREALESAGADLASREVADVLEAVGIVAATVGEAAHAARLLGAAEVMRERMGLRLRMPENQAALEQALATARASLGEASFATAWAAGRHLRPEDAVAEAVAPAGAAALTRRETEVLHLLAAGMTDAAIAEALFISVRTVERHVLHILAKFGVKSRTAAARAGRAAGLVPPVPESGA